MLSNVCPQDVRSRCFPNVCQSGCQPRFPTFTPRIPVLSIFTPRIPALSNARHCVYPALSNVCPQDVRSRCFPNVCPQDVSRGFQRLSSGSQCFPTFVLRMPSICPVKVNVTIDGSEHRQSNSILIYGLVRHLSDDGDKTNEASMAYFQSYR